MSILRFSHLGICVADAERARRFYCDQLGFREVSSLDVAGAAAERLLELPDAKLRATFLERDGVRIELLHFDSVAESAETPPRPMNQPGLSHLSLRVSDLVATVTSLREAGAQVLEHTRVEAPGGGTGAVFILDPDGNRIELVEAPGDPAAPPGLIR